MPEFMAARSMTSTIDDPNAGNFGVFVSTNGQSTVVGYDIDSFQNINGDAIGRRGCAIQCGSARQLAVQQQQRGRRFRLRLGFQRWLVLWRTGFYQRRLRAVERQPTIAFGSLPKCGGQLQRNLVWHLSRPVPVRNTHGRFIRQRPAWSSAFSTMGRRTMEV